MFKRDHLGKVYSIKNDKYVGRKFKKTHTTKYLFLVFALFYWLMTKIVIHNPCPKVTKIERVGKPQK